MLHSCGETVVGNFTSSKLVHAGGLVISMYGMKTRSVLKHLIIKWKLKSLGAEQYGGR